MPCLAEKMLRNCPPANADCPVCPGALPIGSSRCHDAPSWQFISSRFGQTHDRVPSPNRPLRAGCPSPERRARSTTIRVVLRRVTVLAADSPLGLSILGKAAARALELTAIVRDPVQWPSRLAVRVVRGDMLDLTCPELLLECSDTIVVPFGTCDAGKIDCSADLHVAAVLGGASERLGSAPTRLVLAGRASRASETPPPIGPSSQRFLDGGRQLAEHAAVALYAALAHLDWEYVSPSGRIRSLEVRGLPDRLFGAFQRLSAKPDPRNAPDYLAAIVDTVEHHVHRADSFPGSAATSRGSSMTSAPAGAAARRER